MHDRFDPGFVGAGRDHDRNAASGGRRLAVALCALLPASACASDMSGLVTIMFGLPAMLVALLALIVLASLPRLAPAAVGAAIVLFIVAALILFFLLRDSLGLFPRYALFALAFYGAFAGAAACLAGILRKNDTPKSAK